MSATVADTFNHRLKKNGVLSVANPVEKAIQEGRFEELD